jgi:hypothetical protein
MHASCAPTAPPTTGRPPAQSMLSSQYNSTQPAQGCTPCAALFSPCCRMGRRSVGSRVAAASTARPELLCHLAIRAAS